MRSEHPELAAEVDRANHYFTGDRISPALMDQREFLGRSQAEAGTGWLPNPSIGLPFLGKVLYGPWSPPNGLGRVLGPKRAAGWLAFLSRYLAGVGV
jgi:hypothetical protein